MTLAQELIYTSSTSGLKPGSKGFCTVAATPGMPPRLATMLESLSGYRHVEMPTGGPSPQNPVNFCHVISQQTPDQPHILSRVADAGLDYSGRTNKLAHHVVLGASGLPSGGPAALMQRPGSFVDNWDEESRLLEPRSFAEIGNPEAVCHAWQQVAGDAGWAGVLASTIAGAGRSDAWVIFPAGTDCLTLVAEACALLPSQKQWLATYSTFYGRLPPGLECRWRFVLAGSPESDQIPPHERVTKIDLTKPGMCSVESEFVDLARSGKRKARPTSVAPSQPASAEQSVPQPGMKSASPLPEEPLTSDFTGSLLAPTVPPPKSSRSPSPPVPLPEQSQGSRSWIPLTMVALMAVLLLGIGSFFYWNHLMATNIEIPAEGVEAIKIKEKEDQEEKLKAKEKPKQEDVPKPLEDVPEPPIEQKTPPAPREPPNTPPPNTPPPPKLPPTGGPLGPTDTSSPGDPPNEPVKPASSNAPSLGKLHLVAFSDKTIRGEEDEYGLSGLPSGKILPIESEGYAGFSPSNDNSLELQGRSGTSFGSTSWIAKLDKRDGILQLTASAYGHLSNRVFLFDSHPSFGIAFVNDRRGFADTQAFLISGTTLRSVYAAKKKPDENEDAGEARFSVKGLGGAYDIASWQAEWRVGAAIVQHSPSESLVLIEQQSLNVPKLGDYFFPALKGQIEFKPSKNPGLPDVVVAHIGLAPTERLATKESVKNAIEKHFNNANLKDEEAKERKRKALFEAAKQRRSEALRAYQSVVLRIYVEQKIAGRSVKLVIASKEFQIKVVNP